MKEYERKRYDFDPTMFYENRFWNQRPDGIAINRYHQKLCILDFKRSSDRNNKNLRVNENEANEKHRSIIKALRAAAPEWTFEQVNFVAGRRGAVVEDDFYNKLEKLNVQAGKRDKILLAHVQRICEAHDTVCNATISKYILSTNLERSVCLNEWQSFGDFWVLARISKNCT